MKKNNKIYNIQCYVRDVMHLDVHVPSNIKLPAYIFKQIFEKHHSEIWFEMGRLLGHIYNSIHQNNYNITIGKDEDTKQYLFWFNKYDNNMRNFVCLDKEISEEIDYYYTSVERIKKLEILL